MLLDCTIHVTISLNIIGVVSMILDDLIRTMYLIEELANSVGL